MFWVLIENSKSLHFRGALVNCANNNECISLFHIITLWSVTLFVNETWGRVDAFLFEVEWEVFVFFAWLDVPFTFETDGM